MVLKVIGIVLFILAVMTLMVIGTKREWDDIFYTVRDKNGRLHRFIDTMKLVEILFLDLLVTVGVILACIGWIEKL